MLDIDKLILDSRKNQNINELRSYRNLKNEIMVFKTQKNAPVYDDATELKIIQKYVAKIEDAYNQYLEAGREDLASEYRDELEVLKKLLPEPVKESELLDWITSTAIERGWVGRDDVSERLMIPKKEMGNLIKQVKSAFPTADGKIISELVKLNLE